jgi:hypothetical protein
VGPVGWRSLSAGFALTAAVGCTFDPGGVVIGTSDGALSVPDSGPPGASDARPPADARPAPPDAWRPPDAAWSSCADELLVPITPGVPVVGWTDGAPATLDDASCADVSGPEVVHVLELDTDAHVVASTARSTTSYDTILHARTDCENPVTEFRCDDGWWGDTIEFWSSGAGRVYLIVDSAAGESGAYELLVDVETW